MNSSPFEKLTVIGLGLIGGSIAMAARSIYPDLWIQAVDPNSESLQYSLKAGIVDKVSLTLPEQFEEQHLIVLASHLSINEELLQQLTPRVHGKNITVTDIGSCKRTITQLGEQLLPAQFIGGHPMAGKEVSGIQHGTSLLFAGKSYLLCPSNQTNPEITDNLKQFIQALGAVPRVIDAEKHDRYMAYVSHLPQLYSILLTNLLYEHEPGHLLSYHGGGIDDQLRLAASSYPMWKDVFSENKDNLKAVLAELSELIQTVQDNLDSPALEEQFKRSNQVHQIFHQLKQAKALNLTSN